MKKIFKVLILFCAVLCGVQLTVAQKSSTAYRIFNDSGRSVSYGDLIRQLQQYDVVFLGEIHNCPITHWLEYRIVVSLYEIHKEKLAIGEEMFECDNQLILNEYMKGKISDNRFEEEMRLWENYTTDYKLITLFAKKNNIPLIATNIPRRYANAVSREGLEVLKTFSDEAKSYMAPLPIKFEHNEAKMQAMFGGMMKMAGNRVNVEFLAQAQAVKDATMAWNISKNIKEKFVHLNGSAHSNHKDGIIPYLLKFRPRTSVVTVEFIRQGDVDTLNEEQKGKADFYICIPDDMIVTY